MFVCRAVTLSMTVERVKKCLDFGVTIYFFHVVFCSVYLGFPTSIPWWVVNGVSCVVVVMLAEYLCMRRESQTITLVDRDRPTEEESLRRQSTLPRGSGGASAVVINIRNGKNHEQQLLRGDIDNSNAATINESVDADETDSLLSAVSLSNGGGTRERGSIRSPSRGTISRSGSPSMSPLIAGLADSSSGTGPRRNKINVITV